MNAPYMHDGNEFLIAGDVRQREHAVAVAYRRSCKTNWCQTM